MRTKMLRGLGSDGVVYIVFCRIQTFRLKTAHGTVEKQRPPKFYLGNGDLLEYGSTYGTLRTFDGNLILRLVPSDLPVLDQARQVPDESPKSEADTVR